MSNSSDETGTNKFTPKHEKGLPVSSKNLKSNTNSEEKRNKEFGWLFSIGLHALLVVLFLLVWAWEEPDPPIPQYGITLNFGMSDVGMGEQNQTGTTNTEQEEVEEEQPTNAEENSQEEVAEEPVEEVEEITEEIENIESPDVVEQAQEQTSEASEATETPVEYPNSDATASAEGQGETDQPGDQGDPEGDPDPRALYTGRPGSGSGGASLDLAGWNWDFKPKPNDTSDEGGKIIFEIKIDDEGEILSIRTIEKTVSPSVEKVYRDAVALLTFSRTSNTTAPPTSKGRITFIIKAN